MFDIMFSDISTTPVTLYHMDIAVYMLLFNCRHDCMHSGRKM